MLILELLSLNEEAIDVKQASDIWTENSDAAKTYVKSQVYFVKKNDDGKYEVTIEDGTEREIVDTLSRFDLNNAYTPMHANQKPDAEGYKTYYSSEELEAFKYKDDTIKVEDGGKKMTLRRGDYLVRLEDGDNFTYEVKKAKNFDLDYKEK